MARVTVEDCVEKVPNRFELVLLASHRARSISQATTKIRLWPYVKLLMKQWIPVICTKIWCIPCKNSLKLTSLSPMQCL